MQVGTAAALDIALTEQGRDVAGHVRQAQCLSAQQQMGDTWMRRQFGHRLAVPGQCYLFSRLGRQSPKALEQVAGLSISRSRRDIEPDQLLDRHAPARQLQGQPGQIGLENLGTAVGRQLFMLGLGPQAIAHAGLQAPGPSGALGSTRAGNALGVQTGHAAARIEARHPRQPGVDHHKLVSAILVANTTLRLPAGAGSMAARWAVRSSSPCSGHSRISGRLPRASSSC